MAPACISIVANAGGTATNILRVSPNLGVSNVRELDYATSGETQRWSKVIREARVKPE